MVYVPLLSSRMLLSLVVIIVEFLFQRSPNLILSVSLVNVHSCFSNLITIYPYTFDVSVFAQTRLPFNVANLRGVYVCARIWSFWRNPR